MEVEPSRLRRRGGTSFAARRAARELRAAEGARMHTCGKTGRHSDESDRELWERF